MNINGVKCRLLFVLLLSFYSVCMNASGATVSDDNSCDTLRGNLYLKFNLDIKRRNVLLMLVPRMYVIAQGARYHVGETYGDYAYDKTRHDFFYNERLRIGTIKNQSTVFPNLLDYISPHIYEETLFNENILSPFHPNNKRFYKYTYMPLGDMDLVKFNPKVRNSTLTSGTALVHRETKKVLNANFQGEFDLIDYGVNVIMDTLTNLPQTCYLHSRFKLLGNHINSTLFARYNHKAVLPDSIPDSNSPELMAKVRIDSLTQKEIAAYEVEYPKQEEVTVDTTEVVEHKKNIFKKIGDVLYDYLIREPNFNGSNRELGMTPILDPLAIGWGGHTGLSYRMKLWGKWMLGENKNIEFNPYLGYSFKQDQFYINLPIRYTFNQKRDGWIEFYISNGNHISNSLLTEKIRNVGQRDTLDFEALNLEYYRNYEMSLKSQIPLGRLCHIGLATVFHRRAAINSGKMSELGEKTVYYSFAPSLTLKYTPSSYVSYVFNYERGIPGIFGCDSKYERMELDAQFAVRYNALSSLNLHLGAGLYTNMESNDFVDFVNFQENYLPETWDSDWTGHFFLLNSDYYNASKYYVRANLSYESPIILAARIPFVGYYLEKERLYLSGVLMQKTRPYYELGYAFTTRYFSFGVFSSFFGTKFQEVGTKFTFEMFRRW